MQDSGVRLQDIKRLHTAERAETRKTFFCEFPDFRGEKLFWTLLNLTLNPEP